MDLEELRDSRERTRAPVLWLSCEGQINVWELFSGNSHLIAILDEDSWLQHQQTLEPRKKRTSHHSYCKSLCQSSRKKDPKIVVMSPTVTTNNFKQKEVKRQQYRLCLAVKEYQILGCKHFLLLGPESGKIWWLKKVQYLQKKYLCQWTLLRGKKPK